MFEIELKFRVDDHDALIHRVVAEGGVLVSRHRNDDTYYKHPCRDFAATSEALRIRREDGKPMITYKGPKLAGSNVKAREELEWRLDPGDPDGTSMEHLLTQLGFQRVTTVSKDRQTFRVGSESDAMTVTIDDVDVVGKYAEIERVLASNHPTIDEVARARQEVQELADRLGLTNPEPRSYLRMLLEISG
ncbi:class IV adenylate cyclase [Neorhodopirellula pilleata]|uniref:CYTH domain protein n=1 Tax=Neorhodopirellula pilleata TaxID=2714738 RepID=A0A5C6AQ12_9BACT|nr:class IV adenylate cyclase [Neorhodopirellula pilleata]TWU01800.1 CYTH domain protein [Neorhodopirellula pilleata]